jgi:hypothetical protein
MARRAFYGCLRRRPCAVGEFFDLLRLFSGCPVCWEIEKIQISKFRPRIDWILDSEEVFSGIVENFSVIGDK